MREATSEIVALWSRARAVGLTHKAIAKRLGIHPSTFFNYTSGKTQASLTTYREFERIVAEAEQMQPREPIEVYRDPVAVAQVNTSRERVEQSIARLRRARNTG